MNISNKVSDDNRRLFGNSLSRNPTMEFVTQKNVLLFFKSVLFEIIPSLYVISTATPYMLDPSKSCTQDYACNLDSRRFNLQIIVYSCVATASLELILFTISAFSIKALQNKIFFAVSVFLTVITQIGFSIFISINLALCEYSPDTMLTLVALKIGGVIWGCGHIVYLIPVNDKKRVMTAFVTCMRYGVKDKRIGDNNNNNDNGTEEDENNNDNNISNPLAAPLLTSSYSEYDNNENDDEADSPTHFKMSKGTQFHFFCLQVYGFIFHRLTLNAIKTLFEVIPSIMSIVTLVHDMTTECESTHPEYCGYTSSTHITCYYGVPLCGSTVTTYDGVQCYTCPYDSAGYDCSKYCSTSTTTPAFYNPDIMSAIKVQLALSIVSVLFEFALMVITFREHKLMHLKWNYIVAVLITIAAQVAFCLYLAANYTDFSYTTQTLVFVIASKVVAIALGAGHIVYLLPIDSEWMNGFVSCMQYGLNNEEEE